MYEIQDADGVIYSGSLEEMEAQFDKMTDEESVDSWSWCGDLKLVQVLRVEK